MKISQAEASFTVHHAPDTLSQNELRRTTKRLKHTRKESRNYRVPSHIPRKMQIGLVEWACQIMGQCKHVPSSVHVHVSQCRHDFRENFFSSPYSISLCHIKMILILFNSFLHTLRCYSWQIGPGYMQGQFNVIIIIAHEN